jgi:hypothetical protein
MRLLDQLRMRLRMLFSRKRKWLLSVEVSLSVILLICAGLLLKSYQRLRSTNLGCITQYRDHAHKYRRFERIYPIQHRPDQLCRSHTAEKANSKPDESGRSPSSKVLLNTWVLLVAAVACLAPAWQASRLDPIIALRSE